MHTHSATVSDMNSGLWFWGWSDRPLTVDVIVRAIVLVVRVLVLLLLPTCCPGAVLPALGVTRRGGSMHRHRRQRPQRFNVTSGCLRAAAELVAGLWATLVTVIGRRGGGICELAGRVTQD